MKLNHESYEKAFSNITLDDRIGMELLSNAKVKRLRRKKKITVTWWQRLSFVWCWQEEQEPESAMHRQAQIRFTFLQ